MKFTLEDTMEVQKVEMKDARTPETPGVPQTEMTTGNKSFSLHF